MNYIEIVNQNINISEGPKAVESVLMEVYFHGPIANKALSQSTLLPIPIITAIKKEFIKLGLVIQNNGSAITLKGKNYIENQLGFKDLNIELYLRILENPWGNHQEVKDIKGYLTDIFSDRPQVDVTLDQSKSTIETSIKRAILCLQYHSLIGKNIMCVGDDDLISIALSCLLDKLFYTKHENTKITVIDIDKRVADYIEFIAKKESFNIDVQIMDLRNPLPDFLTDNYDCFITDPPYTIDGASLFISRGLEALKHENGSNIFLSYSHKFPDHILTLQSHLLNMKLVISKIHPNFNYYEGSSITGNRGQMIILETTSKSFSLKRDYYSGLLYTGEQHRTIRLYKCKKCGEVVEVGKKIKTIETLKSNGCEYCNSRIFELINRKLAEKS